MKLFANPFHIGMFEATGFIIEALTTIPMVLRTMCSSLTESGDGQEGDPGRSDRFKVKLGRYVEDTENVQMEGKFVWFGKIPSGRSEWDARAPVDGE